MKISTVFIPLSYVVSRAAALSAAEWRSQSIYQVMTDRFARTEYSIDAPCDPGAEEYCGGSWQGIINQLDYIQDMGFSAIWISPVVENLPQDPGLPDGSSYHGYWAQDIYAVNTNFGSASDLVQLSSELHKRNMYLMVDVVTNHMGYYGSPDSVDYSVFNPFNQESYYHSYCPIDYDNADSVVYCWEGSTNVPLPDLRTEDSDILDMWNTWIQQLVKNYTIDGLRVDSAMEVDTGFWESFQSNAGVYVVGEVFNGYPPTACSYQQYLDGFLNYPAFFWITRAFNSTTWGFEELATGIDTMKNDCADTTLLGSFMENHDNDRFPFWTPDWSLVKNAIAFTMLSDGIPIIYEGQEQHYNGSTTPYNREAIWKSGYTKTAQLYTWIQQLNQIRNQAIYKDSSYVTYKAVVESYNSTVLVTRKGNAGYQIISVFTNEGASGSSYALTLPSSQTGFTANQAVIEVMSCTSYTTDSSGNLRVAMASGLPLVLYPKAQLTGSDVCTSVTGSSTSSTSKTATTTSKTTTATSSCTTASSVAVTFDELVTTTYGSTVKIAGDVSALGNWDTSDAVALSASSYTSSNPLWAGTVKFAPGTVIEYKYLQVDGSGDVAWEADPNHTYTVPTCVATAVVSNSWQS